MGKASARTEVGGGTRNTRTGGPTTRQDIRLITLTEQSNLGRGTVILTQVTVFQFGSAALAARLLAGSRPLMWRRSAVSSATRESRSIIRLAPNRGRRRSLQVLTPAR